VSPTNINLICPVFTDYTTVSIISDSKQHRFRAPSISTLWISKKLLKGTSSRDVRFQSLHRCNCPSERSDTSRTFSVSGHRQHPCDNHLIPTHLSLLYQILEHSSLLGYSSFCHCWFSPLAGWILREDSVLALGRRRDVRCRLCNLSRTSSQPPALSGSPDTIYLPRYAGGGLNNLSGAKNYSDIATKVRLRPA